MQRFEYKFVRLEQDKNWLSERPSKAALHGYQEAVQEHARDGWRLVQIFTPGIGAVGESPYFELILERPTPG